VAIKWILHPADITGEDHIARIAPGFNGLKHIGSGAFFAKKRIRESEYEDSAK